MLFSCGAENYKESKKGDSRIFDAPFENDKCSVDGITPFKTTREEIVERYGEATSIKILTVKNMKAGRNIDMVLSREKPRMIGTVNALLLRLTRKALLIGLPLFIQTENDA